MISRLFGLEYPFFTVIAAIFSMENSLSNSYKAGLYRLIGTLVGAVVGIVFVYIQPGNAILVGIGTIVLIFICNTFNWNRAVPIAGVMFAAIMLSLNNKDPLQYSFSRVLDTAVGIGIAVAVNFLVFPPDNIRQMYKQLDAIFEGVTKALEEFFRLGKKPDLNHLRSDIVNLIKFLETYSVEFERKIEHDPKLVQVGKQLGALRSILGHLETIYELGPENSLSQENIEKLRLLKLCEIETGDLPESSQSIIYNYHVGKVLDTLLQMGKINRVS